MRAVRVRHGVRVRQGARTAGVVGVLAVLAACSGSAGSAPATPAAPAAPVAVDVAGPPAGVVVDYQLGGGYPPAEGIGGVVRDVTDVPEPGLWSACYVNGFQTQPGDRDAWLRDHPDLVLHDEAGEPVVDPGWPDELLLDTSTEADRAALADLLAAQVTDCADRGFDAVELDNLDSFTRSGGRLTADGALDLAARLVAVAHGHGLAAGQKNAPDLGTRAREEAGFDFAVAEECARYDECAAYTDVYGAAVLDVEYREDDFTAACADPDRPASTVLRDLELRTPDAAGYVLAVC